MTRTLPNAVQTSQVNSLDSIRKRAAKVTTLHNSGSTPVNDDTTPSNSVDAGWVESLHEAIDAAGMSRKEGAYALAVDPAQLSRGAVTVDRLKKLPLTMQQDYLELVCARAGLRVRRADQLDVILSEARKHMDHLFDLIEAAKERL